MLTLLFICLVLAGKSFDNNKIRQQQDFKYDALPPFPPILTAGEGAKNKQRETFITCISHFLSHLKIIWLPRQNLRQQQHKINQMAEKSKQEAAMKELPPQVGGTGGSC